MRSAGVKPNAATSAALAAGLLIVTARCAPTHHLGAASSEAGGWTQTDDGQRGGNVAPSLHAAAEMCYQTRTGGGCGPVASRGPRSAEVLRAMLALNMRPDAATCVTLVRATAAAHDAGVSECLRVVPHGSCRCPHSHAEALRCENEPRAPEARARGDIGVPAAPTLAVCARRLRWHCTGACGNEFSLGLHPESFCSTTCLLLASDQTLVASRRDGQLC